MAKPRKAGDPKARAPARGAAKKAPMRDGAKAPAAARDGAKPSARGAAKPKAPARGAKARERVRDVPVRRRRLAFRPEEPARPGRSAASDLSALAVAGRTLFVARGETSTIERLILDGDGKGFSDHASFALGDIFDLPGGPDGAMGIGGLAIDDGHLWATGSHALQRGAPGREDDAERAIEALASLSMDPGRHFLGRVPLIERAPGIFEPVREHALAEGPARTARMLKMKRATGRTAVRRMLARDPLLAPFLDLPRTENGFDVAGLAVRGDRVLLGLRGPVLGGRAVLVEMRVEAGSRHLKPRRLALGARHALRLLDLDGLGVRDLLADGDDLMVLAGPVSGIDGPQGVHRITGALGPDHGKGPGAIVRCDAIERVLRLPVREGCDHAAGLALLEGAGGARELLVAFDSPAEERRDGPAVDIDCHPV